MIKNYFITAVRNIRKNKGYSFINIAGLAVGMTFFLLILLYVSFELSYDDFHENYDRIYRVVQRQPGNVFIGSDIRAITQGILAPTMMDEMPEVLHATRIDQHLGLISNGNLSFYETGITTDRQFFNIFSFELLSGDPKIALNDPYSIILSEKLAEKYFGKENPVGKTVNLNNRHILTVTGIHKDVPQNSHFKFDFILSIKLRETETAGRQNIYDWSSSNYHTYFLLNEGGNVQGMGTKILDLFKRYSGRTDSKRIYLVQALKDIHLRSSNFSHEMAEVTDIKKLYMFLAIAVIILLIACINYMNLATARSSLRAREIGIRKVVGAFRIQLIKQFTIESVLFSSIALVVALVFVSSLLPIFSNFIGKNIGLNLAKHYDFVFALIACSVLVGIFAGSYPAFFLSSFRPVYALKATKSLSSKGSFFRKFLVIFQFSVAVILLSGTIVIFRQYQYIMHKELGFNKDQVVYCRINDTDARRKIDTLKHDLLKNPSILNVGASSYLPTRIASNTSIQIESNEGEMTQLDKIYRCFVDYDFMDLFDFNLVQGRNFSKDFGADESSAVIVNEEVVRLMGWTEPIGKKISMWKKENCSVIGVVEDFHFFSLHEKIEPLMLTIANGDFQTWLSYLSLKIHPDNIQPTIGYFENIMKRHSPHYPFIYHFLDENYSEEYASEKKLSQMIGYFSLLAVFISCLGLFGLSSFTAERRKKEIGIRKTLGASIPNIITQLSKEYIKYIGFAFLIGSPVAFFMMHKWLQNFAYHTNLSFWIFLITSVLILTIAVLTVAYQGIRAALADPIEAIKYE